MFYEAFSISSGLTTSVALIFFFLIISPNFLAGGNKPEKWGKKEVENRVKGILSLEYVRPDVVIVRKKPSPRG